MQQVSQTLQNNKKTAAFSLFALGSVLVSYLVYQRVADTERHEKKRRREERHLMRKAAR